MALDLLATFAIGAGTAGLVLFLRWLSGRRLPRWTIAGGAGLAMILYQVWSEYTWAGRTEAALPPGFAVVLTGTEAAPWRPWSYVVPQVVRLAALDAGGAKRNPDHPGLRIADLWLFERRLPARRVPLVFDCIGNRRADIADGAAIGPTGAPEGVTWAALPADDAMLRAACGT